MQLERIFELIRKEDVVLWIGSGFSLYAGYPSGKGLSEVIYGSLSQIQKNEIGQYISLADLSEQFVRLEPNNRKILNLLLQKEFLKPPSSKKWHEILSKIPHVKTIITTNYDRLFELAYKEQLQTVINVGDVVGLKNKVELFKVHGDINSPDSIIISTSDYSDFFYKRKEDDLLWNVIKERMSHKHVLFIGYDLEDENIKNIMRQVSDSLGENQKKMYLVAPDFKAHKVTYLANLGIEYFNFKGEAFVEKLYANIKECITDDFSKGYLSADTLRKFFENNSLNVELKAFNNKFNITSVNGLGDVQPKLSIKFKNEKPESFQSILDGRKFGGLQIDGSQLEQLKVHLNQINIVGNNIDDYRIRIESKAKREGKVNAVFEDSSEYEDIDYKLFTSDKILEIKVSYKNVEYTSQVKTDELEASNQAVTGSLTYNQVKPFANVNDAIKVTELGLHIAKEHGVILYFDGQSKGIPFILGPVKLPIEVIESNLAFFQSLKIVEKYYKVRFTNFDDFSEEVFDNVYKASAFAEKREHIQYWDEELTFDTQNGTPLELLLKVDEGAQLVVGSTEREELDIYDQRILLGYQVMEPLDLFIANLDNLKTGATTKAILKSKTKKIRIHFEETLPIQNETDHSL